MTKKIALIPGDGIGPEVLSSTVEILNTVLPDIFDFYTIKAGYDYYQESGETISEQDLKNLNNMDAVLYAANTNPPDDPNYKSLTLTLRRSLELFANLRPAISLPQIAKYPNVDLTIIRENSEGLYIQDEESFDSYAVAKRKISTEGSQRIIRFACEHAIRNNKQRITVVHKANVLRKTCGLFREAAFEVAKEYPTLQVDEQLVDAMAMELVLRPEEYEVIVTTNLFGDILSDLASALVGGLGVAPGANLGLGTPVFEPVHGSAPDIAGEGIANPTAMILTATLMLEHFKYNKEAQQIKNAISSCLEENDCTVDLGGNLSTTGFVEAVRRRV